MSFMLFATVAKILQSPVIVITLLIDMTQLFPHYPREFPSDRAHAPKVGRDDLGTSR